MRRALIALNTDLPRPDILRPWLQRADLVIACDGAARRLLDRDVVPDLVVGDLDSVLGSVRRALPAHRFQRDDDPERADLEKALDAARRRGARDVTIVGAPGDRLDHALANASLLLDPRHEALDLRLVDDCFVARPVRGRLRLAGPIGTIVSLWTPTRAEGVSTRGLRWKLNDETLTAGTRGIHNELASRTAEVRVRAGPLLGLHGHFPFPHR